jgi:predicted metal-dependent enzyme (double-stranded beta helix superfamily)
LDTQAKSRQATSVEPGFSPKEIGMFDTERFIADCRAAFATDPTHKAIHEVVARAMSDPAAVLKGLGEPKRPEIRKLFHSETLTILNVVWPPGYIASPHDHRMWAVIGVYSGREDNVFWRRIRGEANRIEAAGAKSLCERDTVPLGTDIIHSVINPIDRLSSAIHVYGGDFFATERSKWDSLTLEEGRSDGEEARRTFERASARYEESLRASAG